MSISEVLKNLAETDEECGRAKARMLGLKEQLKTVKSIIFLKQTGGVAEREHKAQAATQYVNAITEYENAIADYEVLHNKRLTWEMQFEAWRSNNANRRMVGGNL